jgi:hypothetical protein
VLKTVEVSSNYVQRAVLAIHAENNKIQEQWQDRLQDAVLSKSNAEDVMKNLRRCRGRSTATNGTVMRKLWVELKSNIGEGTVKSPMTTLIVRM